MPHDALEPRLREREREREPEQEGEGNTELPPKPSWQPAWSSTSASRSAEQVAHASAGPQMRLCVLLRSVRSMPIGNTAKLNTVTLTEHLFSPRHCQRLHPLARRISASSFSGPPENRGALQCRWNTIATKELGHVLFPFSPLPSSTHRVHKCVKGSLVHTILGSSYQSHVIAHVFNYPPPSTRTAL